MKSDRIFHLNDYRERTPGIDDTRLIQSAIDDAGGVQGGKVVVPAGEYYCAGLEIKSGVHLFLEKGASILGCWETSAPPGYPS